MERPSAPGHAPRHRVGLRLLKWPSYDRCLADARPAKNHEGPDRSAADFEFCLISIDRGWSVEHTARQLMRESEKAKSLGYNYALFTSRRAASIVSGNGADRDGFCPLLELTLRDGQVSGEVKWTVFSQDYSRSYSSGSTSGTLAIAFSNFSRLPLAALLSR